MNPPTPPAFETGSPQTGTELAAALGGLLAQGTTYLQRLDHAAFFAPQGTHWSPAEHVRHLRKSAAPLVMALGLPRLLLRLRFGTATRPSRDFAAMREAYRAQLAGGATAGRFAPSAEAAPGDPEDRRAAILEAWASTTTGLQAALRRWDEPALDRFQLPHPVLGTLTVREMLHFTVYHTAHHLRRVAERSGP